MNGARRSIRVLLVDDDDTFRRVLSEELMRRGADDVTAVYVEIEPGSGERAKSLWKAWGLDSEAKLVVVPSPYRSVVGPFIEYLRRTDEDHNDGTLATVVLPEFIPARWWESLLHNQTAWLIKLALLYGRHRYGRTRAIIDWPMYLRE